MKKRFPYTKEDFKKGTGDYLSFKYRHFDQNLKWDELFDEYEYVFGYRPQSESRTEENLSSILFDFIKLYED